MKRIKYKFRFEVNYGTEELPILGEDFIIKNLQYSEEALEIAKSEAYNGEYTIEDDSTSAVEPTADEILNALLGVTV